MRPQEATGPEEKRYLLAVRNLAGGKAKSSVAYSDIQEYLSCSEAEAARCCDFWTSQGDLEWSTRGHIALTHLGLARAEQMNHEGADPERRAGPVSVVIPVLNEARTIEHLVRLVGRHQEVGEVIVVDDGSSDGTQEVAKQAGAKVMMSSFLGKGASMADGAEAAEGDIVLFLDGDLKEVRADFVDAMIAPILRGEADLVKACSARDEQGVTILTARPLLSVFFPELARFAQPLGGIVAVRRALLNNIRLENDYGVDVGLLIDSVMSGSRAAEADIGWIEHVSQDLEALAEMAKQVTRVILDRAWRYERLSINQVRDMEETERRARGELFSAVGPGVHEKFALFDMDGVLLDGRFVVELASRVRSEDELARFLDNETLSNEDRTRVIASLFSGRAAGSVRGDGADNAPHGRSGGDCRGPSQSRVQGRHRDRQLLRRRRDSPPPGLRRFLYRPRHAFPQGCLDGRSLPVARHARSRRLPRPSLL